jgi:hypothetical protein
MTWINRFGAALSIAYKLKISATLFTSSLITFPYDAALYLKNMTSGEKQCHAALHGG